jgi:hypothetical protein
MVERGQHGLLERVVHALLHRGGDPVLNRGGDLLLQILPQAVQKGFETIQLTGQRLARLAG